MSEAPLAVIGLGNPGSEYEQTRHNAGFWLAERLAERNKAQFKPESKFFGSLARIRVSGSDLLILKPSTYMNRSGQAVSALARFYKIPVENLLVAHDELDLPVGTARLKLGGGHGGHNGLRDIHKPFGDGYRRVRIGVGHPGDREQVLRYLTETRPPKAEREDIMLSIEQAVDAIEAWPRSGWEKAVQALHTSA